MLTFFWSKQVAWLIPVAETYTLPTVGGTRTYLANNMGAREGREAEPLMQLITLRILELIKYAHDVGLNAKQENY